MLIVSPVAKLTIKVVLPVASLVVLPLSALMLPANALSDATNARAMPSVMRPSRTLLRQPSITNTILDADKLKSLDGLANLAAEHACNFAKLFDKDRQIAPSCTLRIGTASGGSAQDALCLAAMKMALGKTYPDLDFQYVFNCERKDNKRSWILALHKMLDQCRQTPAHGLVAPCSRPMASLPHVCSMIYRS